ncbi:MAG: septal ring lytic transglycosylase RlpA family protein [Alphaproteobacteria bacterium]
MASWYGGRERGRRTASGERFDPRGLTAASRPLPPGSVVRVTRPDTGASVVVRINDRGPAKRYVATRLLDLPRGAIMRLTERL